MRGPRRGRCIERKIKRASDATYVENAIGPSGDYRDGVGREVRLSGLAHRNQQGFAGVSQQHVAQPLTITISQQGVVDDREVDRAVEEEALGLPRGGGFHEGKPALTPAQLLHQADAQKGRR